MKTPFKIIVAICISVSTFAQEKCETDTELINDINSISITKCSVEDVKKALSLEKDNRITTRKRIRRVKKNNLSIESKNKIQSIENKTNLIEKINTKNNAFSSLKAIPFHLTEQIPLFNKCQKTPLLKQNKCFEKQMIKHVVSNFEYPERALHKKIEGKIYVQFTINKEGDIINIKKRGPKNGIELEKEAERLIKKLPKFIPGKHQGKTVNVKYALPIIFKIPKDNS